MKDRIKDLKELNDNGISSDLFWKLILHSTDGSSKQMRAYSNNHKIENWKKEVYKEISLKEEVSEKQIDCFLNYMCKYFSSYFGKNHDEIYVTKQFEQYRRIDKNFLFEEVALTTIETI